MARVELVNIVKNFGETKVVKDISLSIEPGEFLVLVGPSGCGKSTCLRMIAGLEEATSGKIRIGDRVVNDVAPKDRNIGMVFQSYALYPHMSVRDNMGFAMSLSGASKADIKTRTDSVAEIMGLEELMDRKPKELSGGQRQRVAIGRAITKSPEVFLFDEPLSNLDAALRGRMRAELATLHQKFGKTTVYVTHDQIEAMMLADRIAVLDGGVLQQVGAPLELFDKPKNRFVASFIGSPSMNFLPAKIEHNDELTSLDCLEMNFNLSGWDAKFDGPDVELGIRPQDIEVGQGENEGTVEIVELLGWEAFVHLRTNGKLLIARVDGAYGAKLQVGDTVSFQFSAKAIHVFASSGESVWCGNTHLKSA